ncbi:sigma-w pathway protein ysdB [Jeotgalibacillus malaysiensis]|uniref:Sigma-w pathway protein ysdB n=1 Tax=Jeotgalibacillus malaysiensis TaxID=1508404 RepID=A0A0B5AT08_9BACL|nr:sigma-w pathway protein ysdB [Jeotgalibacillus malaysiensis]AJD91718.1 sigma-w pathway protein ysdB [Jeotgalibacillus malaysiensis]
MILILLRVAITLLILYLLYKGIKYLFDPKRKLELAHEKEEYFFHDDARNPRKNFFITYKGVMFQGEKYLGEADKSFDVINIFVWPDDPSNLQGFRVEDFRFMETEIKSNYPHAKIDWKSPIRELLGKKS